MKGMMECTVFENRKLEKQEVNHNLNHKYLRESCVFVNPCVCYCSTCKPSLLKFLLFCGFGFCLLAVDGVLVWILLCLLCLLFFEPCNGL